MFAAYRQPRSRFRIFEAARSQNTDPSGRSLRVRGLYVLDRHHLKLDRSLPMCPQKIGRLLSRVRGVSSENATIPLMPSRFKSSRQRAKNQDSAFEGTLSRRTNRSNSMLSSGSQVKMLVKTFCDMGTENMATPTN